MARRRYGIGGGTRTGGTGSGGTPYNPNQPSPKPQPTTPEETAPPPFSYDPSINATKEAEVRGLEDRESETKTAEHFGRTDLAQALKDIKVETRRSRGRVNRSASRSQQKLGYQEQDTQTSAGRKQQDFETSLSNIARSFGQLGKRQAENANAAGTLDAGTQAASAAARGQNQRFAEAPIHTAQQRTGEDLATALQRIGTARGQVTADQTRGIGELKEDRDRKRLLAKRGTGREFFELNRKLKQAKREEEIGQVTRLQEEIYAAKSEHPSIYRQWAKEHPGAVPGTGGSGAGSGNGGGGGGTRGPALGAGHPAPRRRRKGGR